MSVSIPGVHEGAVELLASVRAARPPSLKPPLEAMVQLLHHPAKAYLLAHTARSVPGKIGKSGASTASFTACEATSETTLSRKTSTERSRC